MKLNRRAFLAGSLAGLAGSWIRPQASIAQLDPQKTHYDPYEIIELGKTGIKVSRIGLGTGMKGFNQQSNQTRLGEKGFLELIRGCYDRGIRLFDLADIYGSHHYIMRGLKEIPRDKFVLTSKIWFHKNGLPSEERPDADLVLERFLKEIGTDYIDLVLIHCMTQKDWTKTFEKQMELLENCKKKGLIRAHGVSCHSLDALKLAAASPWVDSVHARINPYGVSMDGKPHEVIPVLQEIHKNKKGLVAMKLIGEGKYRDDDEKRSYAVDFVLNLGCVDTMIVGFEKLLEVDDFARRVRQSPRRTEPLKIPEEAKPV